jgi:hypothetical protein
MIDVLSECDLGFEVAGRQGFELGARPVSNMVMARDFWFKRFSHRRLRRSVWFTAVHPNPRDSTVVVETFWRRFLLMWRIDGARDDDKASTPAVSISTRKTRRVEQTSQTSGQERSLAGSFWIRSATARHCQTRFGTDTQ